MQLNLKKEITSVWSFPDRGKWATHTSNFRGNFAPQIPRNVIERYSNTSDIVLDPTVGGGTTGIECRLTGRNFIGFDINPKFVKLANKAMDFTLPEVLDEPYYSIKVGDLTKLTEIQDNSIDLIITHPPYANIIRYSNGEITGDLSNISSIEKFCRIFRKGINHLYRVLKPNHYCAILIGDLRKRKHYIPLSFYIMENFLDAGFALKEDVIKIQHNCKTTPYWQKQTEKYNFLLIMHEHLFIFRKPDLLENLSNIKFSTNYIKSAKDKISPEKETR